MYDVMEPYRCCLRQVERPQETAGGCRRGRHELARWAVSRVWRPRRSLQHDT